MRHRGRASAVLIAILATVTAFLAPTLPADAAGSGVLGVAVAAGAPLTSLFSNGTHCGAVTTVGYKVQTAGSYVVVDQSPAEVVCAPSTYGEVYGATARIVIWAIGSVAAPDVNAAGG